MSILNSIGSLLPTVGALIGGPAGGFVGQAAASLLGVDTEQEALKKIQKMSESDRAMFDLKLEQESTKKYMAYMESVKIDQKSESKFQSWARPSTIWAMSFGYIVVFVSGPIALVSELFFDKQDAMSKYAEMVSEFDIAFMAGSAVVGVYVASRSKDKQTASGIPPKGNLLTKLFKG